MASRVTVEEGGDLMLTGTSRTAYPWHTPFHPPRWALKNVFLMPGKEKMKEDLGNPWQGLCIQDQVSGLTRDLEGLHAEVAGI
jgi:hypothetical protein